jgi:hypothetical protein
MFGNSKQSNKAPSYPPVFIFIFLLDASPANPAGTKFSYCLYFLNVWFLIKHEIRPIIWATGSSQKIQSSANFLPQLSNFPL